MFQMLIAFGTATHFVETNKGEFPILLIQSSS